MIFCQNACTSCSTIWAEIYLSTLKKKNRKHLHGWSCSLLYIWMVPLHTYESLVSLVLKQYMRGENVLLIQIGKQNVKIIEK